MTSKHARTDSRSDGGTGRRGFLKAAGAGAALITTGLSGCTGNSGNGGNGSTVGGPEDIELDIWLSYYTEGAEKRAYTDELMAQYEKETGTTINITGVPYAELTTKFRAAQAAGNVPHLVEVMTHPGVLSSGAGMVVNDLFESSELSDKVADSVMAGHETWGAQATGEKGKLVTFPLGFRPYLNVWRSDWLEQAGIAPEEVDYNAGSLHWLDDVAPMYEKMKQTELGQRNGYFPDTTGLKSSDQEYKSHYIPQFNGSMAGVVNQTGDGAAIDTKEARDAINFYWDFIEKGYFHKNSINYGDEESTTLHWAGKIAVNHLQDAGDIWADYNTEQPDAMKNGEYVFGLPPNAGKKAGLAWLPALGFIESTFKNQAELDQAVHLIDWWIADPQRAVNNADKLGWIPINPEVINTEQYFGQTDLHKEFWRGACNAALKNVAFSVIPAVPRATAITYDVPHQMDQRIHQGTSIEEATSQAADEINQLLQQG